MHARTRCLIASCAKVAQGCTPYARAVKEPNGPPQVWTQLGEFCEFQWPPAARAAVGERQRRLREEAAAAAGGSSGSTPELGGNIVERVLASLATPAETEGSRDRADTERGTEAGSAAGSAADSVAGSAADSAAEPPTAAAFFYGEDEATEADLEERRRRAIWSLGGRQP